MLNVYLQVAKLINIDVFIKKISQKICITIVIGTIITYIMHKFDPKLSRCSSAVPIGEVCRAGCTWVTQLKGEWGGVAGGIMLATGINLRE